MNSLRLSAQPADIIAWAWYGLGYRPEHSYVLIAASGSRHRLGCVVRVDLLDDPGEQRFWLDRALGQAAETTTDAFLVLICHEAADHSTEDGGDLCGQVLLTQLRDDVMAALDRASVVCLDVLAVGAERYRSLLCADSRCCPETGRSLDEVLTSTVAVHEMVQGRVLAPAVEELIADVRPTALERRLGPEDLQGVSELSAAMEMVAQDWDRHLVDPAQPPPSGRVLLSALCSKVFRDAALIATVDERFACAAIIAGEVLAPSSALDARLPDRDRCARAEAMLAAAARIAPVGHLGEALAALAWIAWYRGHGVRARLLVTRALADAPEHHLSSLLGRILTQGIAPEWVRASVGPR